MATLNPNNLGGQVSTTTVNWRDLCMRAWGTEWNAPDHKVYVFGNNRAFDSTDKGATGLYNGGATKQS